MRHEQHRCGLDHGRNHGRGFAARGMMKMMMGGRSPFGRGFGDFGGGFGGWDDESGGRGGRGGGRGRGRMFAGGELRLVLLRLVAEQDRHGYELIKAIEELTGGEYAPSPGVVYPTLSLLVDEGLLAEVAGEGSRKAFTVTEAGRAELAEKAGEADALVERLKAFGEQRQRHSSPPVRRAMHNLKVALGQRLMGGLDDGVAHQIADILDEAARRIERL